MDIELNNTKDAIQEDTLMETGHAPVYKPNIDVQSTETANHSSETNSMDVDNHTEQPSTNSSITTSNTEQNTLENLASPLPYIAPINTTSELTSNTNENSTTTKAINSDISTESRIDAAIAGNEESEDGYESSDLESSDNEDADPESSDSDSDSDHDIGARYSAMTIDQREKHLIEIDEMGDEDESTPSTILHTANEIVQLPEVKKPDITLTPDAVLEPIGTVMYIVDNVVVIQAASSGEVRVLDAGTVTAVSTTNIETQETQREILGEIFETFGPVVRPLYSVRFNTIAEIPNICTVGCTVYSVPQYSSFVLTEPLKAFKGSDASNKFDEEVHDSELEFSDDEKEMEHKRMLKQKKNQRKGQKDRKGPAVAADTAAAMQAMMGETPASMSSASQFDNNQRERRKIALPRKPVFNEAVDGYKILQRPGTAAHSMELRQAAAGAGTVPWYQQHQRELQNMMGSQQHQTAVQQVQREQEALLQFQKQQKIHQELLLQQQQQQQLFLQQQQQQAAYQQQIQEAQATIQRLQQQQQQLQHQQQQQKQQQQPQNQQQHHNY